MNEFGVYVHYPWCRHRCSYCDFAIAVAPVAEIPQERYRNAILAELGERRGDFEGRSLVSIYFGGGTPSLWPAAELARVVEAVSTQFGADPGALEITLEANPVDCTPTALEAWQRLGINRLSIGVQSTDAAELELLGRDHSMGEGASAVVAALAAGFANFSVDVIAGSSPGAGLETARAMVGAGAPHISVYELTLEPKTPLAAAARRGEFTPVDEEELATLYAELDSELEASGYEHYEISSFARPGHRAVHNQLYWRAREYLGLGNGAASFWRVGEGGVRQTNPRSVGRYLAGGAPAVREELSPADLAADRIWLGLRTSDGVPKEAFSGHSRELKWLCDRKLVLLEEGAVRPTLRGFMYADQIARRLLGSG